jgi:hypothetical protein
MGTDWIYNFTHCVCHCEKMHNVDFDKEINYIMVCPVKYSPLSTLHADIGSDPWKGITQFNLLLKAETKLLVAYFIMFRMYHINLSN